MGIPGMGCAVGFSLGAGGGIFIGRIIGIGASTGVAGAIGCGWWCAMRMVGARFVRSNP